MEVFRDNEMNEDALGQAAGGAGIQDMSQEAGLFMEVRVDKNYLALRAAPEYKDVNEIGRLYTGDLVKFIRPCDKTYIYVYSMKHGQYGYVNCNFVINPYTGKTGDPVPVPVS